MNDYAGALSPDARARLEAQLAAYERNSTSQIAVVLLRSLERAPIEDVSMRIAEKWKLGSKRDDGVLVVVATDDHRLRIEVGYGLESRLTDAQAGRIVRDVMAPRFREGRLAEGISAGLTAIETAILGHAPPGEGTAPAAGGGAPRHRSGPFWLLGLFLFLVLLSIGRRRRRGIGFWPMFFGGWIGGSGGWSRRDGGGGGGFSGGGGSFGGGGASGSW